MDNKKRTIWHRFIISFALFFLLVLCFGTLSSVVVFAISDELIYRSDELLIHQTINGTVAIDNAGHLEQLTTKLHLLPLSDYRQVIVDQTVTPQPQYIDDSLAIFKYTSPIPANVGFSIDTTIRTRNTYKQITHTVLFPINQRDIPVEIDPYLQLSDMTDSSVGIRAKAKELAGSQTDLFGVAFSVAQWVSNNIQYDLGTVTNKATKSASWVFDNKKGVCSELSVLYSSMMRSLGVPTRFVSGIAYTNSPLFTYPWSPHAWVEVYFPDFGWVPFDLTYKQFGFIDASHISLQVAVDENDSATQYQWQGYGIDNTAVRPSDLQFTSTLIDARSEIDDFAKPTVSLLRNKVSLTSYSAIVVTLENTKNYYVSAQLGLAAPAELLFPQGRELQLYLRPFEQKTVFIPVFIAPGLSARYEYQFPIAVTNFYRVLSNTTLFVSPANPTYSSTEIQTMSANALSATQNVISAYIQPQCYLNGTALVNKTTQFVCDVASSAKTTLGDFKLCINNSLCQQTPLLASSITTFVFNMTFTTVGVKQVPVRMTANNRVQEVISDVTVTDLPSLTIVPIDVPAQLRYDDVKTIRLSLQKTSFTAPQRVIARIFNKIPFVWNVGPLTVNKELIVDVSGSSLEPGVNTIPITVTYMDEKNIQQTYRTTLQIELVDVSWIQRFIIFLRDLVS